MSRVTAHAGSFALSVVVAGVVQQTLMLVALHAYQPQGALIPLAAMILGLSTVYVLAVGRRKTVSVLDRTTAWLAGLTVAAGGALLTLGVLNSSPGIGGNIAMGLAVLGVVAFLAPMGAAIAIHWWLLRRWLHGQAPRS